MKNQDFECLVESIQQAGGIHRGEAVPSKPFPRPSTTITVILVGLSLLLCLAWFGQMVFVVPAYERHFMDERMRVPYITEVALATSRQCVKYWYALIPIVVVPGFALAISISCLLRHSIQKRLCSVLWFVFVIGCPLFGNAILWLSLLAPHDRAPRAFLLVATVIEWV